MLAVVFDGTAAEAELWRSAEDPMRKELTDLERASRSVAAFHREKARTSAPERIQQRKAAVADAWRNQTVWTDCAARSLLEWLAEQRARELAQIINNIGWRLRCVNTTVREANDRGYDCLVVADCVGSYFPDFQEMGLRMIKAQGGIFGWVASSEAVMAALQTSTR